MCLFKPQTNYKEKMRDYLRDFMLKYINENPSSGDVVVLIFSNVELMIRNQSEKTIAKSMKQNHVNAECGALNILQNFAMIELKPKSTKDFLSVHDFALDLYNEINIIKLNKGYINKKQYDENALLATKLSLIPPLGSWGM